MKNLLISGFDPFGGEAVNPSWETVNLLPDTIGEYRLHKLQIPTVFGKGAELLLAEAEKIHPDVVISVGMAGGRSAVTPERVAINVRSARISDNEGNQPREVPVVPGGPDAYFATIPVVKMAEAIEQAGIPGAVSNSAGTFVCNDVMYTVLNHFAGTGVRAGFIHVPRLPEQGEPCLSAEQALKGLTAALSVL